MKIITTPWKNELLELVSNAKKSIKIITPFVKENVCQALLSMKQSQAKIELITSFKFSYFCSGQSDLAAFDKLLSANGKIKIHPRLNANIYIFDDKKAIISSGNLSNCGLLEYYQYGVYLDTKAEVEKIILDYNSIAKHEETRTVKKADIETIRKMLLTVHKNTNQKKLKLSAFEIEHIKETFDVVDVPIDAITSVFEGWQLEVFNCINLTQQSVFTLEEVNLFENHLKKIFPSQKNIPDKIEIQLKYFIELGLIDSVGNGFYKKLWKY
jgi:predicted secreted Zn-dependent protease